ncbi:MAG TPA: hypothetical protein VE309_12115 [Caulobacteraceae bacterium]|nr:hypothetical protein [Caulobacteraceae bacterium]
MGVQARLVVIDDFARARITHFSFLVPRGLIGRANRPYAQSVASRQEDASGRRSQASVMERLWMSWTGYYINLDRSEARRREIETELANRGLIERYERFPGVDGQSVDRHPELPHRGAVGCCLSHLDILRGHTGRGDWLHILEDDALISRFTEPMIATLVSGPEFTGYDLIFTNVAFTGAFAWMNLTRKVFDNAVETDGSGNVTSIKSFTVLPLQDTDFKLTTSYLVNPRSVDRVASLLAEHLTPERFDHIDTLYTKMSRAGDLSIGCTIPFSTAPRLAMSSTVRERVDPWELPLRIMDSALYVDRDVADLRKRLRELEQGVSISVTGELLSDVQRLLIDGLGV